MYLIPITSYTRSRLQSIASCIKIEHSKRTQILEIIFNTLFTVMKAFIYQRNPVMENNMQIKILKISKSYHLRLSWHFKYTKVVASNTNPLTCFIDALRYLHLYLQSTCCKSLLQQ